MDGVSPELPSAIGGTVVWIGGRAGVPPIGREPWPGAGCFQSPPIAVDLTAARAADQPTACVVDLGGGRALPGYLPCGCYVGSWHGILPPPRFPEHAGVTVVPFARPLHWASAAWPPIQPPAAPMLALPDADVERIARRAAELVVELLRKERP